MMLLHNSRYEPLFLVKGLKTKLIVRINKTWRKIHAPKMQTRPSFGTVFVTVYMYHPPKQDEYRAWIRVKISTSISMFCPKTFKAFFLCTGSVIIDVTPTRQRPSRFASNLTDNTWGDITLFNGIMYCLLLLSNIMIISLWIGCGQYNHWWHKLLKITVQTSDGCPWAAGNSGGSRGGSGGSNEPPLEPKLFHFHGEFQEKFVKLHKSNPPHTFTIT